jgi:glyoxalase family protein
VAERRPGARRPEGVADSSVHGLHHTTGITGDAQANVDFYAGLLGLRLVMRTVNHEDPGTLHLFYGDAKAAPAPSSPSSPGPTPPAGGAASVRPPRSA